MNQNLYEKIKQNEKDYHALGLKFESSKKKEIPTEASIIKCSNQLNKFFEGAQINHFLGKGWLKSENEMDILTEKKKKYKIELNISSVNFSLQTLFDEWYDKWFLSGNDYTYLFGSLDAKGNRRYQTSDHYKFFLDWDVRFDGMSLVSSNFIINKYLYLFLI